MRESGRNMIEIIYRKESGKRAKDGRYRGVLLFEEKENFSQYH